MEGGGVLGSGDSEVFEARQMVMFVRERDGALGDVRVSGDLDVGFILHDGEEFGFVSCFEPFRSPVGRVTSELDKLWI